MDTELIQIPWQKLSPEALQGLVQEFVLREGTDYGPCEHSLEAKVEAVFKQLRAEKVFVCFDPRSESVDIRVKD